MGAGGIAIAPTEPAGVVRYAMPDRKTGGPDDPRVVDALDALERVFADAFVGAALVGASADPSRGDRVRAPEVLGVVERVNTADLASLGDALRRPMSRGLRLRVLTRNELVTSADAFALEMAEFRDRHVHLRGDDVLAAIEVEGAHLRLDLERRLRGLVRRLRNRALQRLGHGHPESVHDVVTQTFHATVIVAHHALALAPSACAEPPSARRDLLAALCEVAGVPSGALLGLVDEIDAGKDWDALSGLDVLLPVLEAAASWADGLSA